ncbi:uncharacterized protein [Asterias amurensis]|uniref:uncharacterized protein n=1 Tax=Asterias amurensis TaxID=7602 RepID=UPI003AB70D69
MDVLSSITTQGASLICGSPDRRQVCSWLPFNSLCNKGMDPQILLEEQIQASGSQFSKVFRPCNIETEMPVLVCQECSYTSKRRSNLVRHCKAMHSPNKHIECCGEIFKSKSELRHHVRHQHKQGYSCTTCRRVFCRKALLKRHMSVHSGVKAFTCKVCSYASSHKSNLERHQRIHDRNIWELGDGQQEQLIEVDQPLVNPSTHDVERTLKQLTSIYQTFGQSTSAAKAQKSQKGNVSPGVRVSNNPRRMFAVPYKCLTCNKRLQSQRALKKHEKVVHPDAEVRALHSLPLKQAVNCVITV